MSQHSSSQSGQVNSVSEASSCVDLPPQFKMLEDIAIKFLNQLKDRARESDDAQERFTNSGYNFVVGAELTSKMATRAAASASKISA